MRLPGTDLTPGELASLREFLDAPGRPESTLTLRATQGLLFAVANGPVTLQPSQWLPEIYDPEAAEFSTLEEAEEVIHGIMTLYNRTIRISRAEGIIRPEDLGVELDDHGSLGEWSRGFMIGYAELKEPWDRMCGHFEDDDRERFDSALLVLSMWADPDKCREVRSLDDEGFAELAEVSRDTFPQALTIYARVGWQIHEALQGGGPGRNVAGRRGRASGRNDPCPCGSGLKFKKCCGA
jgi:uncharacterized protein